MKSIDNSPLEEFRERNEFMEYINTTVNPSRELRHIKPISSSEAIDIYNLLKAFALTQKQGAK